MSYAATRTRFSYMDTMSGVALGGRKSCSVYAMAQNYNINIKVKGLGEAGNQLAGFTDKLNETREEGNGVSGALALLTGGAAAGFKKAATGAMTFVAGLKLTRAAIIATGVGALVVGITALVAAFAKTRRGARMLKVAMAPIGAIMELLTARAQALGGFIVDLFGSGPTAAVKNYRKTMDELPGSMAEAASKAIELERATQALTDSQRELTVQRAKDRAEIKRLNMIAEDTTRTLEEREAAAKKAIEIEMASMAERERIAAEELRIAQEKAAMSDSSEEDLQNLADLEANLINIRTQSFEVQTTLNNKLNTIRQQAHNEEMARLKEEEAAAKARADKRRARRAERIRLEEEVTNALQAAHLARQDARTQDEARLEAHYDQLVEKAGRNKELIQQIEEDRLIAKQELEDKYAQKELDAQAKVRQTLAEASMSKREKEKAALQEHFDALLEQAGENAELQKQVEEARETALAEMRERFRAEDKAKDDQARDAKNKADDAQREKDLQKERVYQDNLAALKETAVSSTFGILSNLSKAFEKDTEEGQRKAFKRNKAISIAETLVSTYQAAQKAYASQLAIPSPDAPIRAQVAAGIAVAAGLAKVAAIKSTQFGGGASAGGATGGGLGGGTQSVGVDVGTLVPTAGQPTPEPVRAYVVSNEISNKQALDRELQIQTTL